VPERSFFVRLGARVDDYENAMKRARAATSGFSKETEANLLKVGGQMQKVGGWATTRVTVPLAALGAGAVKMGYDFDKAFSQMVGLAGVAAGEVDGLKESVLELSGQTAVAPQQLAEALYFASSAGLDTAGAMDAVTMAAKASASGMGSAADIVGLVASAVASYGKANITAAEATDVLTAAVREGRADPAELASRLGTLLPIAGQLGISFGEVGGATAYLSNVIGDTGRTVTALSGIFNKLAAPSKQAQEILGQMGTSTAELKASIDQNGLLGALDLLREHGFADNSTALRLLFDDTEAYNGAIALLNDNSGTLAETIGTVSDSAGSLDTAFNAATSRDGFKLEQALNDLKVAMVQVGDVLLPVAADIASSIAGIVNGFTNLPSGVQKSVLVVMAFAAAAGPLIYIAGTLIKNLRDIATVSKLMGDKLSLVSGKSGDAERSLTGLGKAAKAAGLALATVVAVDVAGGFYNDITGAAEKAASGVDQLTIALGGFRDGSKSAAEVMKQFRDLVRVEDDTFKIKNFTDFSDTLTIVGGQAGRTASDIKDAFGKILDVSPDMAAELLNAWKTELADLIATLDTIPPGTPEFDRIKQQAIENGDVLNSLTNKYEEVTGAQLALNEAADPSAVRDLTSETSRYSGAVNEAGEKVDEFGNVLGATEVQVEETTTKASDMVDALDLVTSMFDSASSAAGQYSDSISSVFDPSANLTKSTEQLFKSMDQLKEGIDDNGTSLDIATKKGQANRDNVKGQVDAIEAHGAALRENGASALEAGGAMETLRKDLLNQMEQMGFNRQEAEDYIAQLGLTPQNIETAIRLEDAKDTAKQIEDIKEDLGDIDEADATEIDMLVESGDLDAALAKLQLLQLIAGKGVQVPVTTYTSGGVTRFAQGDVVDQPTFALFGEAGAEVVLPLTNPARMRQLLNDPRVSGRVRAALGMRAYAAGGIVGSFTGSDQVLSRILSAGGGNAGSSATSQSSVMANRHEVGDLSDSDYRSYLAEQLAGLEQYSDDWMQIWRQIKSIDDDAAKAQADRVKAAEDAAAAEVAAEDQKYAAMFELGEISRAQYEAYLQSRLGSFEIYSADWMTRWRQLADLQQQAEKQEADRREQEAKDALKRLEILFDRADARAALGAAERDVAAGFGAVDQARADLAGAQNDDERANAQQSLDRALDQLASDAVEGAKARARVNGLQTGTAEWARFVRGEVERYAWEHPEFAGRLMQDIADIPRLAGGALIQASPGGSLVQVGRVAEAGQDEWILPDSKLVTHARTAAQMGYSSASSELMSKVLEAVGTAGSGNGGGVNIAGDVNVGTRNDLEATKQFLAEQAWKARTR
jgi:TP901 family phage tail tape measure protein